MSELADQLPRLIRVEGDQLVCQFCRRRWRVPQSGDLNMLNREYLLEHALAHERITRLRRPQSWLFGPHGKAPDE